MFETKRQQVHSEGSEKMLKYGALPIRRECSIRVKERGHGNSPCASRAVALHWREDKKRMLTENWELNENNKHKEWSRKSEAKATLSSLDSIIHFDLELDRTSNPVAGNLCNYLCAQLIAHLKCNFVDPRKSCAVAYRGQLPLRSVLYFHFH